MIQTDIDKLFCLPFISMVVLAVFSLCTDLFKRGYLRLICVTMALVLPMVAFFPAFLFQQTAFGGMLAIDSFTGFYAELILVGALLCLFLSHEQLERQHVRDSVDIDVLLIFATLGAILMVASAHLLMFFVGFELLSVVVYVLAGAARKEKASSEAAMKYFILGAFSSAFLLYGMALVYGATGSLELAGINTYLSTHESSQNPMLLMGLGLMLFGFCFKLGAVPFHFWAPDVYQGAPVSITAYMAVVVKVAAFGGLLRLLHVGFAPISAVWEGLIWTISALTMTVGNVMAVRQTSVKRMLAYSSVAHAGYALMGFLVTRGTQGVEAVSFYLLAYTFMSIVAFGVVLLATGGTERQYSRDSIESFRGLGWRQPLLGILLSVSMLALAGMPPLAGFMGKLMLFSAAVKSGFVGLAIIAAINSAISLYYYLGILVALYFTEEDKRAEAKTAPVALSFMPTFAVFLATFAVIYFGLFSDSWVRFIASASKTLGA